MADVRSNADIFSDAFHEAIIDKDISKLAPHIADDAQFHSPAFYNPKQGRDTLLFILSSVSEVFEGLTYVKEWTDGNELLLEFRAKVKGKDIHGIDRISLNDAGKIVRFEVMVRPLNGLMALAEEMGKKFQAAGVSGT